MTSKADRVAFLLHDKTRLRIAEWCSAEKLTRGAIAERLGRPSGGISAPETMLGKKALRRAGSAPGRSGRAGAELLKLNESWRPALDEALRFERPGSLRPDTDLLLIQLRSTRTVCELIVGEELDFAWGVRLAGGPIGLLVSPRADVGGASTVSAAAALDAAGVEVMRITLRDVLSPEGLKDWARTVVPTDPVALPPGDG
jgi:hypothetical protein